MKYTNMSSVGLETIVSNVGDHSVQSARVHRLVKAFVDQIKKRTFTDEIKACHRHINVSLNNQFLIEAD